MRISSSAVFAVPLTLVALSHPVQAAQIIFSGNWLAAQLLADPAVKFPSRTPTLVTTGADDELQWGAGGSSYERFLEIPMVPANTLSNGGEYVVSVQYSLKRETAHFEPAFTLSDGDAGTPNHYKGLKPNMFSTVAFLDGIELTDVDDDGDSDDTDEIDLIVGNFGNVTQFPDVLHGEATWLFRGTVSTPVSFRLLESTTKYELESPYLDLTGELSFGFWLHPEDVTGGLHQIAITVYELPEAGGAILCGQALGIGILRRRLRRRHP